MDNYVLWVLPPFFGVRVCACVVRCECFFVFFFAESCGLASALVVLKVWARVSLAARLFFGGLWLGAVQSCVGFCYGLLCVSLPPSLDSLRVYFA